MSHLSAGLSVIVPFYNEAGNVIPLIEEITQALQGLPFEILAVDDASTDGTFNDLAQMAHLYPFLKVFRHDRNYGQSPAILTGARHARYTMVVTLDGDGQNDPKDIMDLWRTYQNLPAPIKAKSVIFGNRAQRQDNILRRLSSWSANKFRSLILNDFCPDTGCALKMFPTQAFLELPAFNHFHRFLPALFQRADYQIINVKVSHRPRLFGKSKYGVWNRLWVGLYDMIGVKWLLNRKCSPHVVEFYVNSQEKPRRLSA